MSARKVFATLATSALLLFGSPLLSGGQGNSQGDGVQGNAAGQNYPHRPGWYIQAGKHLGTKVDTASADPSVLTDTERFDLSFMRVEEKLARDVYLTLGAEWGLGVFANISESEQRHMDAMKILLDRYSLPDPVTDNEVGALPTVGATNFADVYEALIARGGMGGENDQVDALMVGAWIEERDILDLRNAIAHTAEGVDNPDIVLTYESLLCGSRNHLRTFVHQIEEVFAGGDYVAQLSEDPEWQSLIDGIVDTDTERCGRKVMTSD